MKYSSKKHAVEYIPSHRTPYTQKFTVKSDLDGRRIVSVVILHLDDGDNVSLKCQSSRCDLGQLIPSLLLSLCPSSVERGEIVEHVEAAFFFASESDEKARKQREHTACSTVIILDESTWYADADIIRDSTTVCIGYTLRVMDGLIPGDHESVRRREGELGGGGKE